jgi:hypothetical protein
VSAAALSSLNMRGETETPTPSNCGQRSGNCNPLVAQRLRALLDEIITAQCELEARLLATKAAKLAELVALVEVGFRKSSNPSAPILRRRSRLRRRHLIRLSSQLKTPNDPISRWCQSPSSPNSLAIGLPSPAVVLVRSETVMAEVAFVETPAAQVGANADQSSAAEEKHIDDHPPPAGPLSSIMSLSEDERLALFS